MAMNHSNAGILLLCIAVSMVPACGGGGPGTRDSIQGTSGANAAGRNGSVSGLGASGTAILSTGDHSGTTASSGSGSSSGSTGTGSKSGTGSGTGAGTGSAAHSGTGSAAGSDEESSSPGEETSGGENGGGGINQTIDYGPGSGNTADLGGVGGSLDIGAGGSQDLGAGGSQDLGTGGTIDTCIPSCTPDLLGVGEKAVNLVVFENAKASGCDTEGRMWVGGNANLEGYGVGHQLKACDPTDPVLVVGGNLHAKGGIRGSVWVGGEWDETTKTRPECGGIQSQKPGPVDFPHIEAQLTAYSKLLASYPANGATDFKFGSLTFTGKDKDMNIFSVAGDDLAGANGIVIDVPTTSTVIINVTGTSTAFENGTQKLPDGVTCSSGSVKLDDFCNKVVWNMPDVKTLDVSGTAVQGTVLAPHATLTGNAQINGTVIIDNLNLDGCVEMHPHYFNGCLCTEEVDSKYACCPK